jgi:phosphoribulokinase
MSFGASPSDFVMLLKALNKLAKILSKEAVESFKRCARTYRTVAEVAKHLDSFAAGHDIQGNDLFRYTRQEMEMLLREYFDKIEDFKHFLGPSRVPRSLRNAVAKIKWSRHEKELERLRQDLETQINIINVAILTSPR